MDLTKPYFFIAGTVAGTVAGTERALSGHCAGTVPAVKNKVWRDLLTVKGVCVDAPNPIFHSGHCSGHCSRH